MNEIIKQYKFNLLYITLLILFSCTNDDDKPTVTNEGVFINEIYSSGNDWVELYNADNTTKNISGYFIYDDADDKYTIPANTVIQPKAYLILICDGTGTGLHTSFKLSSTTGEIISLENSKSVLIDQVTFPALEEGKSYARDPDGSNNIVISNPTQGAANGGITPPTIKKITRTPIVPGKSDAVTIKAIVKSSVGISIVKLFYRFGNESFETVTMSVTADTVYSGIIPALNIEGIIEYYIEAKNIANKTSVSPVNAPAVVHSYIINSDLLPNLVINEFMASNIACCTDPDGTESEYDDWIEIYNKGSVAVNIGGMHLSDDPENPFKFKVAETNATKTTIQPGGYLLIWADETKAQGELHASFQLSSQGEHIGLYYLDGRTIDEKIFDQQNDDTSYGRVTDGAATWKTFTDATPGASNN